MSDDFKLQIVSTTVPDEDTPEGFYWAERMRRLIEEGTAGLDPAVRSLSDRVAHDIEREMLGLTGSRGILANVTENTIDAGGSVSQADIYRTMSAIQRERPMGADEAAARERLVRVSEDGPFVGIHIETDETIPQDMVKLRSRGEARVFRLDPESESAEEVARWPEDG